MTYQEALDIITLDDPCGHCRHFYETDVSCTATCTLKKKYDESVEKIESLIEKETPKKPIRVDGVPACPNCGCNDCGEGIMYDLIYGFDHCTRCGQALDWS